MEIEKAEFQEWLDSKVTQFVMDELKGRKESCQESLSNGATLDMAGISSTESVVGRIQGLNDFLLIEYEGND